MLIFDKVTESVKVGTFFETQCRSQNRSSQSLSQVLWTFKISVYQFKMRMIWTLASFVKS